MPRNRPRRHEKDWLSLNCIATNGILGRKDEKFRSVPTSCSWLHKGMCLLQCFCRRLVASLTRSAPCFGNFCLENETAYQHVWRSTEFSSCVILQIAEPLGLLEGNRTAVGKVDVEITAGHTTLAHGAVLHFVALDCMCRRPN
jgi:hypothetical protein